MDRAATAPEVTVTSGRTIRVWDPVVRLFHWTVVLGCALNLFVFEDGKAVHRWIGYAVASALAIRVLWGFIGPGYARFASFVPAPRALVSYLKALAAGHEPRYLGHNPAGAVMMVGLMAILAALSLTGWMLTWDAFFGSEDLEDLHEMLANALLVLAALHAIAALFESWRHRENLVWSMITGDKRA